MQNFIITLSPHESEQACRDISANLPEWFGIPQANERYANGVRDRLTFGYVIEKDCIGIISLEFPFETSGNIYWMGVKKEWHNKGIGKALLRYAEMVCIQRQVYSLSVETLSPKEKDENYLKTFGFYLKQGFSPLFELNTYAIDYSMVYLNKAISPKIFEWIDLTHEISEHIPTWNGDCGFKHISLLKYEDCDSDCQFLVQKIEMLSGVGTHIDAPAHCSSSGKTVSDLALETLISPCIVIDVSEKAHADYCISIDTIQHFEKQKGKIWKNAFVIFYTGWDRFWLQPEKYQNDLQFPYISKEVAQYLVDQEIVGIGVDTLSPDRQENDYPVHQIILNAGKYIVENIANANLLPPTGSYIFVMPLKLSKASESPIRLLAMIQKPL